MPNPTNQTLFIVEDDPKLRQMLCEYFVSQEFNVTTFEEGESAIDAIVENQPDIVLLDLMLPGVDGLTICRQIRPSYSGKVLMLTASDDDFDHVAALEIGADDFVTKPIKPRVLLARMRMLLRRVEANTQSIPQVANSKVLEFGQLKLNDARKVCELAGEVVSMSDSEFDLLWALACSPDEVLSRDQLTKTLRGIEYDGLDRTVDNKIVSLRKKLGDTSATPKRIITVRGKGYLFVPDTWL
ncbi:response regulator [Vibrio europaeus]|uniref:Response regulator n=1 Tax=Vibrio europaeus TaxID=300876 RepID=A0A178JFQ8_9VIBR|nr:response regulator [Vibrio europaeus]MDC5707364.1 response regulator [Vibrio europaeus]MDC5712729.1 response regulator [Vibrio europaeus]MDC5717372.1 response regulator [Vibrio europaeus]MDC5721093.1 response regulator [Vibrio europaeus]MDC5726672.1 response regulator [Vibrio europaeus]